MTPQQLTAIKSAIAILERDGDEHGAAFDLRQALEAPTVVSDGWIIKPDGEANFFTVLDSETHWLMRVQHNGEALPGQQLANVAMLVALLTNAAQLDTFAERVRAEAQLSGNSGQLDLPDSGNMVDAERYRMIKKKNWMHPDMEATIDAAIAAGKKA